MEHRPRLQSIAVIHDDFGKNGLIFSYTLSLKGIKAGTQERNLEAESEREKNGGVLLTDMISDLLSLPYSTQGNQLSGQLHSWLFLFFPLLFLFVLLLYITTTVFPSTPPAASPSLPSSLLPSRWCLRKQRKS